MAETNYQRRTVIVGEDENVEGINFSLVRGGVVTGKVTDADGRAVILQQVNLYRLEPVNPRSPQRQFFPSANGSTDDRGIYRMFGLAAGRYIVGAGNSEQFYSGQTPPTRLYYQQVFHLDVTDSSKATVIEVSEGSEATNVDITLGRPVQTFSASGRIVDGEKGLPVPNIRFGLQRQMGQRAEVAGNYAVSNRQGDFVVDGLAPGKYGAFLLPDVSPTGQNSEFRVETGTFDVLDQDVSGVTIRLAKGSSVSGVVVLDSEDKAALAKLLQMRVRTFVSAMAGGSGPSGFAVAPISPDGSFRLAGLPAGLANVQLETSGDRSMPKGFVLYRIERDGIPQPRGIEIKEGEQITGVRLIYGYGNATVRGVVEIANGVLPDAARIFVRLAKPGTPPLNVAGSVADARGHFLLEGVPAGVYELVVSVNATPRIPNVARRDVSVQDGAVTDVSVILDFGTAPKP